MNWKIYFCIITFASFVLWVFSKWKGIDIKDTLNIWLMSILVITTICYVERTSRMSDLMQQSNQLNFRPYIQIIGYPATMLDRMEIKRNGITATQSNFGQNERSFGTGLDPQKNEYLLYSLQNIGNVPARNIQHEISIFEWSEKYAQPKEIKIPSTIITEREIVFPKAEAHRSAPLGQRIIYRTTSEPLFIDAIIKISYRGDNELDKNVYFTMMKLRFPVVPSPTGGSQISIIDQDEGKL